MPALRAGARRARRALRRRTTLFLLAVLMSIATGFAGYATLHRTSEFNRRNFLHIMHAEEARRMAEAYSGQGPSDHIALQLGKALEQARWCTETLTPLERLLLDLADADQAVSICERDRSAGERGMILLARFDAGDIPLAEFRAGMLGVLDDMIAYSVAFAPYVDRVERKGLMIVGLVTAALGTVLCFFVWRGGRTTLSLWDTALRERNRFDAALAAMAEGFAIYDKDDVLVAANTAYRELTALDPDAVRIGMTREEVVRTGFVQGLYGKVPATEVEARVRLHMRDLDDERPRELRLVGERHLRVHQRRSELGDRVVVRADQTPQKRQQLLQEAYARALEAAKREVERQAREDPLTGLPNRRAFEEALAARRIGAAGQGGDRDDTARGAVLVRIDLDHFKYVNDTLGHAAGDAVLKHLADILRDEADDADMQARIGGDEFVILMRAGSGIDAATALVSRLQARIDLPFVFEGRACRIGASFGIAESAAGAQDGDELQSFADTALYEAKDRGRGRLEVFTPSIHERLLRNRRLADEIRNGLQRAEFEPFLQPQVDAHSREITGVEVLARWRHPTAGLRPPADFLELAHQLRLTGDIDGAIFDRAAREVPGLRAAGVCPPKFAFNVSSQRMHDPALVDAARALAARGPRVAFELLESISLEEESRIFAFHVDALKEAGIAIEIDDFGSGRASVLGVMQVGPDRLKIDQRLVRPMLDNDPVCQLVRAIVEIGRALGIAVTAEGVETEEHARLLTDLGCDTLQGYFVAAPMAVPDYIAFARAYGPGTRLLRAG